MSQDAGFLESNIPAGDIDFSLPAELMAKEFGSINVRKRKEVFEIQLTLLIQPQAQLPKAWMTGVALDASSSMKKTFGRFLQGTIPAQVARVYEKNGWLKKETRDGRKVKTFLRPAVDDAVKRALVSLSSNHMDYLAPEFITYLARHFDVAEAPTLIYWAGGDGSGIELVGNIKETAGASLTIDGPKEMAFGAKTLLLPAFKYLVDRVKTSHMGLFVFITDGRIDDLSDVKQFTALLAQEIIAGKREQVKCVLIGLGSEIDERQMEELDALTSKSFISIWDHMIVGNFQETLKIFAQIIREAQIVGRNATIYDSGGNALRRYPDGLPTRLVFSMPVSSPWFELEIDAQRIRQIVKVPKYSMKG